MNSGNPQGPCRAVGVLVLASAWMAGCGESGDAVNLLAFRSPKWISITAPTSAASHSTDSPTIDLSGEAEPDEVDQVGSLVLTDPPLVSWSNATTGASG